MIHFATCERHRALEFLKKLYPSQEITDTKDCAGDFLDLVAKDIVRVQDPMMHGLRCQVIPGNNWSESYTQEVLTSIAKFHGKEGA